MEGHHGVRENQVFTIPDRVFTSEKTLLAVAKTASQVTDRRIVRQTLAKVTVCPMVKKASNSLDPPMDKQVISRATGHAIPLIGGAISGAMTRATFAPTANKLKDYLEGTPLANPENATVVDAEAYGIDDLSGIEAELDEEIAALGKS